MSPADAPDYNESFISDVIDLSRVDLSDLAKIPSAVLQASIQRVSRELAEGGETSAYFQSSLRRLPADDTGTTH